jgi:hypothetical protein
MTLLGDNSIDDVDPTDQFVGHGMACAGIIAAAGRRMPQGIAGDARVIPMRALGAVRLLVYAYSDGIDKVAHEYGLGSAYDAELAFADRLVADLLASVPSGTTVIITADHGQVDCGPGIDAIDPEVLALTARLSGEGRFRWLHCQPGKVGDLMAAAEACHGSVAWVRTIDQMRDEHWFGDALGAEVEARLGDVALLPFEPMAFADPEDTGPFELIGRHGSLTSAEMLVPCLMRTT